MGCLPSTNCFLFPQYDKLAYHHVPYWPFWRRVALDVRESWISWPGYIGQQPETTWGSVNKMMDMVTINGYIYLPIYI